MQIVKVTMRYRIKRDQEGGADSRNKEEKEAVVG